MFTLHSSPACFLNANLDIWFLSYFGNTQVDIYAVDENMSDFINQVIPAQGGELRQVRFKINGGIGIFGGKTKAKGSFKFYLKP